MPTVSATVAVPHRRLSHKFKHECERTTCGKVLVEQCTQSTQRTACLPTEYLRLVATFTDIILVFIDLRLPDSLLAAPYT